MKIAEIYKFFNDIVKVTGAVLYHHMFEQSVVRVVLTFRSQITITMSTVESLS